MSGQLVEPFAGQHEFCHYVQLLCYLSVSLAVEISDFIVALDRCVETDSYRGVVKRSAA